MKDENCVLSYQRFSVSKKLCRAKKNENIRLILRLKLPFFEPLEYSSASLSS